MASNKIFVSFIEYDKISTMEIAGTKPGRKSNKISKIVNASTPPLEHHQASVKKPFNASVLGFSHLCKTSASSKTNSLSPCKTT